MCTKMHMLRVSVCVSACVYVCMCACVCVLVHVCVCLLAFDQKLMMTHNKHQYHTRQHRLFPLSPLPANLLRKPWSLWGWFSAIPTRWKKYIRNYTSSYTENADGSPHFLLTFHFLWHKAESGLEKQHARETLE